MSTPTPTSIPGVPEVNPPHVEHHHTAVMPVSWYALRGKRADCDRCGVRARVVWRSLRTGGVLAFCGHHGHRHGPRLLADGWECVAKEEDKPRDTGDPDRAAFV